VRRLPKDYREARKLDRWLVFATIIVFSLEVLFTLIDFVVTYSYDIEHIKDLAISISELESFNFLDVIQIILTVLLMYLLIVYSNFVNTVVKKDDPFKNS